MKKLITILAVCVAGNTFAQKMLSLTNLSNSDTLRISEAQVVKIEKTSTGSNLSYIDGFGDLKGQAIRERTLDTANVAATITLTFAGSAGSVDSITINGVEIMNGTVAFTSNLSTTLGLVEDSIDNNTQSPVNYTASNTATTVTISAPAAFGDTANGYEVVVYTTTLTVSYTTGNDMAGGFTAVRNIITLSDGIFNTGDGTTALEASMVRTFIPRATTGCTATLNNKAIQSVYVVAPCHELSTNMNAHQ